MRKSIFTMPPSPRPPPPKYPLFTTKFFSTKSFGPGHLVGAGLLVLGVVGLGRFVGRRRAEAERARRMAEPPRPPRRPEAEPALAQVENARGEYGAKP